MNDVLTPFVALSPLDGRYFKETAPLTNYFSEFALNKFRIEAEIKFLVFFIRHVLNKEMNVGDEKKLHQIFSQFDLAEAQKLKQIESKIKHDVKAVEYYIRQKLRESKLSYEQYVHFGLTSEDTNSLAQALMLQTACRQVLFPQLTTLINEIAKMAEKYKALPMLARTHGQPAIPTTVGKELIIFAIRLHKEFKNLQSIPIEAKMGGAVGNFTSLHTAFPKLNWLALSDQFITSLGLQPNHWTTQILPADSYTKLFQSFELINTILISFDQDMWRYISDEYFLQRVEQNEVGSSTMPQKVNPIHFENSEGNLGLANAMFQYFATKLPISRLQRDLSDSTVKRNFGSAFGYCLLGYTSCQRGLSRVQPNTEKLQTELLAHWEITTEGIQTLLRLSGDTTAYEKLKTLSRGKKIDQESLRKFIHSLEVDDQVKKKLTQLTPLTYLGLAQQLVEVGIKEIHEN
ncbi:MAG: adenylosuccinate lyase [Patescibacteria group bacterium]